MANIGHRCVLDLTEELRHSSGYENIFVPSSTVKTTWLHSGKLRKSSGDGSITFASQTASQMLKPLSIQFV